MSWFRSPYAKSQPSNVIHVPEDKWRPVVIQLIKEFPMFSYAVFQNRVYVVGGYEEVGKVVLCGEMPTGDKVRLAVWPWALDLVGTKLLSQLNPEKSAAMKGSIEATYKKHKDDLDPLEEYKFVEAVP